MSAKIKKFVVKGIVTHARPHLDEIACIWLLRLFGYLMFIGIDINTPITYWTGGKSPDGRTAEEWEKDGYLLLGIDNSMFDEHEKNVGKEKKKKDCAFTLLVRYLGLEDNLVLSKIIEYVRKADLNTMPDEFTLATIVKDMHSKHPMLPDFVIYRISELIDAKYYKYKMLYEEAAEDYKKGKEHWVKVDENTKIPIFSVQSDSERIAEYARSPYGCRAAFVVQMDSGGNAQISSNQKYVDMFDFEEIVKIVRADEFMRLGKTVPFANELVAENTIKHVPWHYFKEGGMLMNGSLSHPGVIPTLIPFDELVDLVIIALSCDMWMAPCTGDKCVLSSDCYLYSACLTRCQKCRGEIEEKEKLPPQNQAYNQNRRNQNQSRWNGNQSGNRNAYRGKKPQYRK